MKCSTLNVDFSGVRFDPLGLRSLPYERIKFGYPLAFPLVQVDDIMRTGPVLWPQRWVSA